MTAGITVRRVRPEDEPFVLALNEKNVDVLAPMDAERFGRFRRDAELFWIAEADGRPAAFLLALREGRDYASENYRWFSAHYDTFLYVDRIVIDRAYRGNGLGRLLYEQVIAHAASTDVPVLCAEIDTEPVFNDTSLQFHAAMGFREVGTQYVRHGTIKVSLQARDLLDGRNTKNI